MKNALVRILIFKNFENLGHPIAHLFSNHRICIVYQANLKGQYDGKSMRGLHGQFFLNLILKGQCHEIFDPQFFFINQPP
jgi:hypothetical protein